MRSFFLLSISLLTLGLAACSGGAKDAEPAAKKPATKQEVQAPVADSAASSASSDDHHAGETNVQPHDDSLSPSADHIDDPNEPAHGHSSSHDDSNEPPHRD